MTVKTTKHSESRIHAQVDLIELRKNLCLEWKETEAKVEKAVAEQFLQQLVRQVERLHLGGSAICRACCARTMQEEHSIFRFFKGLENFPGVQSCGMRELEVKCELTYILAYVGCAKWILHTDQ